MQLDLLSHEDVSLVIYSQSLLARWKELTFGMTLVLGKDYLSDDKEHLWYVISIDQD